MPRFSERSEARLRTCHPDLQAVLRGAIERVDFTILCGHRGQEDQEEAFRTGTSTKRWPHSRHNSRPSEAVDVAPWLGPQIQIDWEDLASFARLAGYLERVADEKGVRLRWGGDWNGNYRTRDERFVDAGHFELVTS